MEPWYTSEGASLQEGGLVRSVIHRRRIYRVESLHLNETAMTIRLLGQIVGRNTFQRAKRRRVTMVNGRANQVCWYEPIKPTSLLDSAQHLPSWM